MQLSIHLPTRVLADLEVDKVVAEGRHGSFCLLPRHSDTVAALVPGLFAYCPATGADPHGAPRYLAMLRRSVKEGRPELEVEQEEFGFTHADVGSVLADLRSRGAEIRSVVPDLGVTEVRGRVRLAAVIDYASALRSMTQGKASVRFELGRFVRVPVGDGETEGGGG